MIALKMFSTHSNTTIGKSHSHLAYIRYLIVNIKLEKLIMKIQGDTITSMMCMNELHGQLFLRSNLLYY